MPSHKHPDSLQYICMKTLASTALRALSDIANEESYGSKLITIQGYLYSQLKTLFDELCEVILEMFFTEGKRSLNSTPVREFKDTLPVLTLVFCEETKKLKLTRESCYNVQWLPDSFWKNYLSKLTNIVQLDIIQITLTDEMFQVISNVCKNLSEISVTSNIEFSSKGSVEKLLACEKLTDVTIDFVKWYDKNDVIACVRKFIEKLRHLQHFHFDELAYVLCNETKETSLRSVTETCINATYLANVLRVCPALCELDLNAKFTPPPERETMLNILAASSQKIRHLRLQHFPIANAMTHFLEQTGRNLRILSLSISSGTITLADFFTIGTTCLNLEYLEIVELYSITSPSQLSVPSRTAHMSHTQPRIFDSLTSLSITSNSRWDQEILTQILKHANNLAHIVVKNIFAHNVYPISEIMSANPLGELLSLTVVSEKYGNDAILTSAFSRRSLQHLITSCSRLTHLDLHSLFDGDTILYLEDLKRKILNENLDFTVSFTHVNYKINTYKNAHGFSDFVLYEDY